MEDLGWSQDDANKRVMGELDYFRNLKVTDLDMTTIFRRFCTSLGNSGFRQGAILGGRDQIESTLDQFKEPLCGFHPNRIKETYDKDYDSLGEELRPIRIALLSDEKTASPKLSNILKSYSRGVLDGAEYFSRFESVEQLSEFLSLWLKAPEIAHMLPVHLGGMIYGMGDALAADFLKEIGVTQLAKPDRWVRRFVAHIGEATEDAPGATIQRAVWMLHEQAGPEYPPSVIDKLMYMVGSGQYVAVAPHLPYLTCNSRFDEFTKRYN